jgi:cell division protein FtsQ
MIFRAKRNRRRIDVARRTGELKAAAQQHAPTALRTLALLTASAALCLSAWQAWRWATTSAAFALEHAVVTGASRATEAELLRLGGVTTGANLLALDVDGVERAIAAHPWVKQVRVRRALPGRLDVEVVEHQPVALLSLGELYLVDQDGEPFKRVTVSDGLDLPLISGLERERFLSDARPAALADLRRGLEAASAYAHAFGGKAEALSEVNLTAGGVVLVTSTGQEVRLGDTALAAGLARLKKVRAELEARALTAEVIRLDNRARPDRVTVQLTGGGP